MDFINPRYQSLKDERLLNKNSGCFRVKRSQINWYLGSNLLSESKQSPKQTLHCISVYISETKRSIWDVDILLHPFSRTRLPTNEICAWLPCYRFQRGPNLPLEIRQLPVCPVFPSSLLLVCSPAPAPTHLHFSGHVLANHALGTLLAAEGEEPPGQTVK